MHVHLQLTTVLVFSTNYSYGESSVSVSISTSSSSTGLGGGEGGALLPLDHSPYSEHQIAPEGEADLTASGGLRSPPGLPHPASATSGDQQQIEPTPATLSLSKEATCISSQPSSIESQLHLPEVTSSTAVLKPAHIDLPLDLPPRQTNPSTTVIEVLIHDMIVHVCCMSRAECIKAMYVNSNSECCAYNGGSEAIYVL